MTSKLLLLLASASWLLSAALLIALALRMPMRRWFGAEAAYKTWLIVPAVLATSLAPVQLRTRMIDGGSFQHAQVAMPAFPVPAGEWSTPLIWVWLAGAVVLAGWFWRAHRSFVREIGELSEHQRLFHSNAPFGGPMLLGLWKPKLILPSDFCTRYTPAEQRLVIRHEQVHAERGDPWSNLLQALMQCVFWFNPLVHLAALMFRTDQELACDAAVLRTCPGERRAYAAALLKSQQASLSTAVNVACHWRSTHPIKERIMSIQQNQPSRLRRTAGRIVIASLMLASAGLALASRADIPVAGGAAQYAVATSFQLAGQSFSPRFTVRAGENIKLRSDGDGKPITAEFQVHATGSENAVAIKAKIGLDNATVAEPALMTKLGQSARIRVDTKEGPLEISLVVTETR